MGNLLQEEVQTPYSRSSNIDQNETERNIKIPLSKQIGMRKVVAIERHTSNARGGDYARMEAREHAQATSVEAPVYIMPDYA